MKRLYARFVLWLIRPALEFQRQRDAAAEAKHFVAFHDVAPWSADRAAQPILLDDPEAQTRLIERAVFPWRARG